MPSRAVLLSGLCLALLAGCGSRKGPEAGVTYFWKVVTSEVQWGDCSDESGFRASATPPQVKDNTYITYKVASDGKTASTVTCSTLDVGSCAPSTDPIVFDIAGNELTWSHQLKSAVGTSTCNLVQDETWIFEDQNLHFTLDMSNALSLDGDKTTCDRIEANQKAASPNKLGVVGCVVTFHLTGDFQ